MIVGYSHKFNKNYLKRIKPHPNLVKRVEERIGLFTKNPNDPILKNHQLTGSMKGLFSISINGDVRAIYFLEDVNVAHFIDIGTHNQVYSA